MNAHATPVALSRHFNFCSHRTMPMVNAGHRLRVRWIASRIFLVLCTMLLSACGPSEQQKAAAAEQKRIECLEKFCEGDLEPERDNATELVFKINGEWFVGPKIYGNPNFGAISFYWPSKTASNDSDGLRNSPEVKINSIGNVDNFYDIAIQIFLTGRARWSDEIKNNPEPWLGKGEGRFEELQKEGFRMQREQLRPDLERVRFFDAQGNIYRNEFFIATKENYPLGTRVPSIGCESPNANEILDAKRGCTGGFFWQPDISVDIRLHAKHAQDWPEIYQEIIRVLTLLKKV